MDSSPQQLIFASKTYVKPSKSSEHVSATERDSIKQKILLFLNKENKENSGPSYQSYVLNPPGSQAKTEPLTNVQSFLQSARPPKKTGPAQRQTTGGSLSSNVTVTQRRNSSVCQGNEASRSIDQTPIDNIRNLIDRLSVMNDEAPHTNHIEFGMERIVRPKKKMERNSSVSSGIRCDVIEGEELMGTIKESTELKEKLREANANIKETDDGKVTPPKRTRGREEPTEKSGDGQKKTPNQSKSRRKSPYSINHQQKPLTSVSIFCVINLFIYFSFSFVKIPGIKETQRNPGVLLPFQEFQNLHNDG